MATTGSAPATTSTRTRPSRAGSWTSDRGSLPVRSRPARRMVERHLGRTERTYLRRPQTTGEGCQAIQREPFVRRQSLGCRSKDEERPDPNRYSPAITQVGKRLENGGPGVDDVVDDRHSPTAHAATKGGGDAVVHAPRRHQSLGVRELNVEVGSDQLSQKCTPDQRPADPIYSMPR